MAGAFLEKIMGEIVISSDRVRTVHCRNGSVLIRSRDSGWKFFHPGRMVTEGNGLVVISFGIGWQFYVSRSEKQPDGTWQDVDSKTVSASGLEELFSARNPLHTPDPLPAHVEVEVPEELIDDCD